LTNNIYGSSRVGIKNTNKRVTALAYNLDGNTNDSTDIIIPETINSLDPVKRSLGEKQYELSNHLGNVLVTVSDRKLAEGTEGSTATGYRAEVLFASDYYPFGMQMPGREFSQEEYRYGFNGQERDDEISGEGNSYTAEYWQYDSRLGRRWNTDPVVKHFESPYATFRGSPIWYVDPNGDDPSTHIDENGDVIAEYDDGDDGVYVHETGTIKETIDNNRDNCDGQCGITNTDGGGYYIGELGGSLDLQAKGIFSNKLAQSANMTLAEDFTFGDWYNNVGSGIWDLKNNRSTIWGVAWAYSEANKAATGQVKNTQFVTPNLTFEDASDFGNYHAGFTGSMFGVPVVFQQIGAGAVEQLKDLTAAEFMQVASQYWQMGKFWERNAFMDETDDHYWNTLGMGDARYLKKELKLGPNNPLRVVKQ
jgi:RHS repeat-associated protein